MSNYHVLHSNNLLTEALVAFHIPIPDENNDVDVNLREALVKHLRTITTVVPYLETEFPTEWTNIQNGSIYEHAITFKFSSAYLTAVEKRTELDNKFTSLSTSVVEKIRNILRYYGLDRDVP